MNDKTETWKKVISVDLQKRLFKDQGVKKSRRFEGTIETDGIGVSIIKKNMPTTRKKGSAKVAKKKPKPKDDCMRSWPTRPPILHEGDRHFRILRKVTKPTVIKNSEALLSKKQSFTVGVDKFLKYIKARTSVDNVLSQYYGNETQKSEEIYFPDSCFDFHVNEKGNLYFGSLYITRIQDFS
ncbi:hypothetical protein EDC94DRAFT_418624 [Helicostylum pulchrum]|nr:hypothetical protein EDC94DRAFT_418624 [Helicostylum pulchrum]